MWLVLEVKLLSIIKSRLNYWKYDQALPIAFRMFHQFNLQSQSCKRWATKPLYLLFMKIQTNVAHTQGDTAAFHRSCREVEVPPYCFHVTNSSQHAAICQGQIFHRRGKEIWAITIFEQQDSGKWESWRAARECNWSPGIFTWGLINMPLKHSRHICPKNKDTADNDDQKCLNFYQLLTDKLFKCLGHPSLMWIQRYV